MADERTPQADNSDAPNRGADPGQNLVRVCAIGASAGGIKALSAWFSSVPPDLGVAYVVIVHLAPDYPSELAATLQPRTKMPITQVQGKMRLEPDHVYIIPPDRRLVLSDSSIEALTFAEPHGRRAPIDHFFRSLASARHDGIGVILSGAGTDGAVGIRTIKEAGGLILVQDPEDAEFALMPRSAIATGIADVVLPLPLLAERFAEIVRSPVELSEPLPEKSKDTEEVLNSILTLMRTRTAHDFSQYKRSTLLRRIARRMQVIHSESINDYYKYLQANANETPRLLADILISVTSFFRDPTAFEALAQQVIPTLFDDGDASIGIRVWVPACATGEEAYSIAMLLLEEAARREIRPQIQIFATDIDDGALATARDGRFPTSIEADVSEERLRRFFNREGTFYAVRKELRDLVVFASHNVLRDPPFMRLDLVSCRNLLIYLERNLQGQVCETFHYALKPDRYLFLGTSENADSELGLFKPVDKEKHIFQSVLRIGTRTLVGPHMRVEPQVAGLPSRRGRGTYPALISAGELHRAALETNAPPSVLVDGEHRVVHISETAGRYILPSIGPMSTDLTAIARPELRTEIQKALGRAFDKNEPSLSLPIAVSFNGSTRRVAIQATPLRKSDQPPHAIVYFLDASGTEQVPEFKEGQTSPRPGLVTRELETELQLTRDRLRATIEEYEATNEELRAANEELQSTNEEYRSTAEELETSKEELQSINEELQTVNSELKLNLERVSRAHNDLENLVKSTEVGTLFLDTNLKIKLFTPKVAELFNVVASDIGRPITDFTHHLEYDDLVKDMQKVLKDLIPVEQEVRADARRFLMRIRPYRTSDNRIEGVVITFVDVTKDREAQREVRRQAALIDLSPDAIIVCSFDGTIQFWSRGAQSLYGYSQSEAKGKMIYDLLRTRFRVPRRQIEAQLRQTGSWQGELAHTARDGREIVALSRWKLERDVFSGEEFVLENNIDITERKRAEEILAEVNLKLETRVAERTRSLEQEMRHREEAQAALAQVQRMEAIGQLAGGIAHDVNNLLTIISGNLEVVMQRTADDTIRPSLKRAMDSIEMGASLTRRLLSFARLHRVEPKRLSLNDRVAGIVELLRRTLGERITISMQLATDLSQTFADPLDIDNALLNLALNARDAMPDGGTLTVATRDVTLDAAAAERGANARPGDYVVLTVSDTGCGMAPEVLRRAVEPLYTTKGQGRGTGLGLSTIYGMAQQAGGFLTIDSTVGKGTSVELYLPRVAPEPIAEPTGLAEDDVPKGDGELVLVVEDNDDVRDITSDRLESLGYTVLKANNGPQAIKLLKSGEPVALVFSDIVMPGGMTGYDVAKWVLSTKPKVKVVLTTGHSEAITTKHEIPRQVKVLGKPYGLGQLARTVREVLDG